jgi:large subunit ribosomal protein L18e
LIKLIRSLKEGSRENKAGIWRDIADCLLRSRSRRIAVNLSRINRYTKDGESIVVPGKVLGAGTIEHPINVAAFAFSEQAQSKILKAKGKCLTIPQLMEKNPKGSGVKIIG